MRESKGVYLAVLALLLVGIALSLTTGPYPLDIHTILTEDGTARSVFLNLRLSRTVMALLAGFGLSIAGYVYQTMFKNPIAAPDIIGVSSGACVGAGVAILFWGGGTLAVALSAFLGGMVTVVIAIVLAAASGQRKLSSFVLSGIAVNAVAQALLMLLKRTADPEQELAALEFWIMGSLSAVVGKKVVVVAPVILLSIGLLFLLHRQITMLSLNSDEAKMLGVPINLVRNVVLIVTTMIVGAIVSITGLITFIGLIGPHITRLCTKFHTRTNMFFAGLLGSGIMLLADAMARATAEIPISIITSLLGGPLLMYLVLRGGRAP